MDRLNEIAQVLLDWHPAISLADVGGFFVILIILIIFLKPENDDDNPRKATFKAFLILGFIVVFWGWRTGFFSLVSSMIGHPSFSKGTMLVLGSVIGGCLVVYWLMKKLGNPRLVLGILSLIGLFVYLFSVEILKWLQHVDLSDGEKKDALKAFLRSSKFLWPFCIIILSSISVVMLRKWRVPKKWTTWITFATVIMISVIMLQLIIKDGTLPSRMLPKTLVYLGALFMVYNWVLAAAQPKDWAPPESAESMFPINAQLERNQNKGSEHKKRFDNYMIQREKSIKELEKEIAPWKKYRHWYGLVGCIMFCASLLFFLARGMFMVSEKTVAKAHAIPDFWWIMLWLLVFYLGFIWSARLIMRTWFIRRGLHRVIRSYKINDNQEEQDKLRLRMIRQYLREALHRVIHEDNQAVEVLWEMQKERKRQYFKLSMIVASAAALAIGLVTAIVIRQVSDEVFIFSANLALGHLIGGFYTVPLRQRWVFRVFGMPIYAGGLIIFTPRDEDWLDNGPNLALLPSFLMPIINIQASFFMLVEVTYFTDELPTGSHEHPMLSGDAEKDEMKADMIRKFGKMVTKTQGVLSYLVRYFVWVYADPVIAQRLSNSDRNTIFDLISDAVEKYLAQETCEMPLDEAMHYPYGDVEVVSGSTDDREGTAREKRVLERDRANDNILQSMIIPIARVSGCEMDTFGIIDRNPSAEIQKAMNELTVKMIQIDQARAEAMKLVINEKARGEAKAAEAKAIADMAGVTMSDALIWLAAVTKYANNRNISFDGVVSLGDIIKRLKVEGVKSLFDNPSDMAA